MNACALSKSHCRLNGGPVFTTACDLEQIPKVAHAPRVHMLGHVLPRFTLTSAILLALTCILIAAENTSRQKLWTAGIKASELSSF
jgi:hypothetical protein